MRDPPVHPRPARNDHQQIRGTIIVMNGDEIRVSDQERKAAAERLSDHLVSGRITSDEHSDRLDAVLAARTEKELAIPFQDLPVRKSTSRSDSALSTQSSNQSDLWARLAKISSAFSVIIFFFCGFVLDGWAWAWIAFLIPGAFASLSKANDRDD